MSELLTRQQAAEAAGVAESTARSWMRRYSAYFPTIGGSSTRYPRYGADTVERLRTVAALSAERLPPEEIEAALRAQYAPTLEAQPSGATEQPQPLAALGEIIRGEVRAELAEHTAHAEATRREVAMLRVQVHELTTEMQRRLPEPEARRATLMARVRAMVGRRV